MKGEPVNARGGRGRLSGVSSPKTARGTGDAHYDCAGAGSDVRYPQGSTDAEAPRSRFARPRRVEEHRQAGADFKEETCGEARNANQPALSEFGVERSRHGASVQPPAACDISRGTSWWTRRLRRGVAARRIATNRYTWTRSRELPAACGNRESRPTRGPLRKKSRRRVIATSSSNGGGVGRGSGYARDVFAASAARSGSGK